MRPFSYQQVLEPNAAVEAAVAGNAVAGDQVDGSTAFLAGGTSLLDLMKLDVMRPQALIDINPLHAAHSEITITSKGLRLGALARMADIAANADVLRDYPAVAQSLQLAASAQLRNMASIGGNLLQRTRCSYFRDTSYTACNKRIPGSGCAAMGGINRIHAVLGVTEQCIASYPGDFAQVMIAFDGKVDLLGPDGARTILFSALHRPTADTPHIETTLRRGELIAALFIPAGPHAARSAYIKVRDRQSYAFAIASAAVAMDIGADGIVRDARIGMGGIHYAPYRAKAAEDVLRGRAIDETSTSEAAAAALQGAVTHGHNDYKPELARRTLIRALVHVRDMSFEKGN